MKQEPTDMPRGGMDLRAWVAAKHCARPHKRSRDLEYDNGHSFSVSVEVVEGARSERGYPGNDHEVQAGR
jgi:hypothetical protein